MMLYKFWKIDGNSEYYTQQNYQLGLKEKEIILHNKNKFKKFMTTKPTLQRMLEKNP